MKKKRIAIAVISIAVVLVVASLLTRLVVPKYEGTDSPLEGNFTAEYYNETTKHDVLFVGDCEVYENFDPTCLWEKYGITSYIRGNAQQQLWQSYYMLEDALRHETPQTVVFNVQELLYNTPEREEYNRMTFDGMKWSATKWNGIRASKMPDEKMIEYVFPLLRYHSRILDLKGSDFSWFAKKRQATLNGYYMRIDEFPLSKSEECDPGWLLASPYGDAEVLQQYAEAEGSSEEESAEAEASGEAEADPDEMDIDESEADEMDIDESEVDEMDIDESEADEMDIDESEADEMDIDESEADEMDIDESEADEMDIDESEADEMDIDESEADDTGSEETGSEQKTDSSDGEGKLPTKKKQVFGDYAMKYLDQICALCREKGIQLILIKAPSASPEWPDEANAEVVSYAKEHNLPYINFYELLDETGINYEEDTYDGGLHMNYSGAQKLSVYFGKVLQESYKAADHRADPELAKVYEERIRLREEMIQGQKKELETYGEIKTY